MTATPHSPTRPPISTVIITHNEERNIERCLQSVAGFSDEIIVVDSGSADRTPEMAAALGARVIQHPWAGYGPQKRFAVSQARNPWIFSIDADEVVPADLAREIVELNYESDAYAVPRAVWYLGRWIRHGIWYPGYVVRLFRRDRAAFTEDVVHESVRVDGRTRRLRNDLLHYSYRDVGHHLAKMDELSTLGAKQMWAQGRRGGALQLIFRPPLAFFKSYVWKRGFLDGKAGLVVAALHAQFIYLKFAKLKGLEWSSRQ